MYFFNIGTYLGEIVVWYSSKGLKSLYFCEEERTPKVDHLVPWGKKKIWPSFARALESYLRGEEVMDFREFPLDLEGYAPFTREVLTFVREHIPYGRVISYGSLAKALGRDNGARAVGRALASNLLPIIIPCHRVVKADGSPGGYTPGRNMKGEFLKIEKIKFNKGGRVNYEVFIRW